MKIQNLVTTKANPQGRLDILAARIIDRLVAQSSSDVLRALYMTFQPELHKQLKRTLNRAPVKRVARALVEQHKEIVCRL